MKFCISAEVLDAKLSEKSNFETYSTKARVSSKIFNYVMSCNVFKDFGDEKKNVQRVLVTNLVEISKDFLIFISTFLKSLKQGFIQSPFVTFE